MDERTQPGQGHGVPGGPQSLKGTQRLKVLGEDAAADYLQRQGFKVIVRNWRARFGELDLVAMDGDTLVFVEVKTRQADRFIDPALAVDHRKQEKVRRLAEAYLAHRMSRCGGCRFDVISVLAGERPPRITHIVNAF